MSPFLVEEPWFHSEGARIDPMWMPLLAVREASICGLHI